MIDEKHLSIVAPRPPLIARAPVFGRQIAVWVLVATISLTNLLIHTDMDCVPMGWAPDWMVTNIKHFHHHEKDVKKQPTSTNFGTFTPGYKLNYCPPQNLRFMHVDPSILTDRQMWKTALMESYSADESQWYYHNPVPLHMLSNFEKGDQRIKNDGQNVGP